MSATRQQAARTLSAARSARTCASAAGMPTHPVRGLASAAAGSSGSAAPPPPRRRWPLGLSLAAALGGAAWFFGAPSGRRTLSPQSYSEHGVVSNTRVTPPVPAGVLPHGAHTILRAPVSTAAARALFSPGVTRAGMPPAAGEVVVQHVMVGAPAIQIERPYTPVNDAGADGYADLVVKRVRGGEVGRLVHSLVPGEPVALRGPITTFSLRPDQYDTVVMVSTGTGVAPFLQLLAKADPSASGAAHFRLLQATPRDPNPAADWSASLLAAQSDKWGDRLEVHRIPPGPLAPADVKAALADAGRVIVLVCLPPPLMQPLCGNLTPMLEQGPLTGMLADLGLKREQVWKLQ